MPLMLMVELGKASCHLTASRAGGCDNDYHASRVLPGFQPDSKLKMLLQLKDQAEIIISISADAIEKNKIRGDLGIHLTASRAGGCDNDKRPCSFNIIIFPITFIADDMGNVAWISFNNIVRLSAGITKHYATRKKTLWVQKKSYISWNF